MDKQFENFKKTIYALTLYIFDAISTTETWRVRKETAEALKDRLRRQWDEGDEVGMARTRKEVERMFLEEVL